MFCWCASTPAAFLLNVFLLQFGDFSFCLSAFSAAISCISYATVTARDKVKMSSSSADKHYIFVNFIDFEMLKQTHDVVRNAIFYICPPSWETCLKSVLETIFIVRLTCILPPIHLHAAHFWRCKPLICFRHIRLAVFVLHRGRTLINALVEGLPSVIAGDPAAPGSGRSRQQDRHSQCPVSWWRMRCQLF